MDKKYKCKHCDQVFESLWSLILGDIDLEDKRADAHCTITFPLIDLQ